MALYWHEGVTNMALPLVTPIGPTYCVLLLYNQQHCLCRQIYVVQYSSSCLPSFWESAGTEIKGKYMSYYRINLINFTFNGHSLKTIHTNGFLA